MLMSLQAGSIEGAGMQLAIPRDPQRIACMDEGGKVLVPFVCHERHSIHVKRAIDNAPCVTPVCRRAEHVFAEECRILASHVCG